MKAKELKFDYICSFIEQFKEKNKYINNLFNNIIKQKEYMNNIKLEKNGYIYFHEDDDTCGKGYRLAIDGKFINIIVKFEYFLLKCNFYDSGSYTYSFYTNLEEDDLLFGNQLGYAFSRGKASFYWKGDKL